jgi:hypothetical protein
MASAGANSELPFGRVPARSTASGGGLERALRWFGVCSWIFIIGCSGEYGASSDGGNDGRGAGSAVAGDAGALPSSVEGAGGASIGSGGTTSSGGVVNASGASAGALGAGTGGLAQGGTGGDEPVDIELALRAYGANSTVGLEWTSIPGVSQYRVHFSTAFGALGSGQSFVAERPGVVHRGLTNGTTYYYVVTAMTGDGETAASPEASATPAGEWVLEELGTGEFDDVVTGGRTAVPMEERQHIVIFPEGYTPEDLSIFRGDPADGTDRGNDVDRWIDEVFEIEPYSFLREAFVVWYLPRASTTRIDGGDTAFDVAVTHTVTESNPAGTWATGSIDSQGETATRAWEAVNAHPFPPAATGSGGLGNVLNFTAAFLILDPNRNRAGLSGRALGLREPGTSRRLSSGFGIGHAHEFTHAFAGLRDEYMHSSFIGRNWPNNPTTNVVGTNVCDELPWAHLLAGAGIHTTEELVGAFGAVGVAFHSELLCLMNGTHINGTYFASEEDEGRCREDRCTLRSEGRMCNHCREVTAFRVFERSSVVASHDEWVTDYRGTFYERFGFRVPAIVPQSNDRVVPADGTPIYHECVEAETTASSVPVEAALRRGDGMPTYDGCVLVEP